MVMMLLANRMARKRKVDNGRVLPLWNGCISIMEVPGGEGGGREHRLTSVASGTANELRRFSICFKICKVVHQELGDGDGWKKIRYEV